MIVYQVKTYCNKTGDSHHPPHCLLAVEGNPDVKVLLGEKVNS